MSAPKDTGHEAPEHGQVGSVLLAFKTQEKNGMVVVKAGGSIDS